MGGATLGLLGIAAAGGAAELYRRGGEWWIVWAQPLRGVRPWTGPPPEPRWMLDGPMTRSPNAKAF